jgi:hypothetical protein
MDGRDKPGHDSREGSISPMSMNRRRLAISLTIAAVLAAASAVCAHAQDSVEAFYQGRQINLIVGYGPGGGYDLTARLLARHIGRYIPGNPSVAVQNLVGAGSLRAANYLYGAAPKDGATFGVFGSDIAMIGLIGANTAVQFDARKFTWLGSSSSFRDDAYVLIVRADAKSPSLVEARRPGGAPLVLGGTGEGVRDADVPKSCAMPSASISSRCLGIRTRHRSCSPSNAASSRGARSISPRSGPRGPNGSGRTAPSTFSFSSHG